MASKKARYAAHLDKPGEGWNVTKPFANGGKNDLRIGTVLRH